MNTLDYCNEKSAAVGYIWPYVRLYVRTNLRPALDVLLAFRRELEELTERQLETEMAKLRLHWWRNEINENRTTPSQHPLLQAINEHRLESIMTPERMSRMINATETALDLSVIRDEIELLSHAENIAGVNYEMLAALCAGDENAIKAARKLGTAEHLLKLRKLTTSNSGYVPADRQLNTLAKDHIELFYSLQPIGEYRMLPAIWVAAKLLTADATQAGFDPQRSPIRANWIAWRAAREGASMKLNNERT